MCSSTHENADQFAKLVEPSTADETISFDDPVPKVILGRICRYMSSMSFDRSVRLSA